MPAKVLSNFSSFLRRLSGFIVTIEYMLAAKDNNIITYS